MSANIPDIPFFSIITVTKNNCDGLRKTLKSIKNQTLKDYEWVVIDGNSDDETVNMLTQAEANWLSEPDSGIYDAMNKGIARSSGTWLIFLNAGDSLSSPEILAYLQKTATADSDFIFGDSFETSNKGDIYKTARSPDIARGMFTHHQSMLYKRENLNDLRYDTDYKITADYDFTARYLKTHPNTQYINIPICIFEHGGVSQINANLGRAEQHQIRKNLKLANPIQNIIITSAQKLIWVLRRLAPNLYWHLKSSDNTVTASAQIDTQDVRPKPQA